MAFTNKLEKEKQKLITEKCQSILTQLLRDDDNKYCVDCDAKGLSVCLSLSFSVSTLEPSVLINSGQSDRRHAIAVLVFGSQSHRLIV